MKIILIKKNTKLEKSLHLWFVTGFSDGISSFSIWVRSSSLNKFGFNISLFYRCTNKSW